MRLRMMPTSSNVRASPLKRIFLAYISLVGGDSVSTKIRQLKRLFLNPLMQVRGIQTVGQAASIRLNLDLETLFTRMSNNVEKLP
jgi:hypothetical protein